MTIEPLVPGLKAITGVLDVPLLNRDTGAEPGGTGFADALARAFGDASGSLERADRSERAFALGRGGLQEMVLQRAQADVALSLASAAATRASQALSTILGMQI